MNCPGFKVETRDAGLDVDEAVHDAGKASNQCRGGSSMGSRLTSIGYCSVYRQRVRGRWMKISGGGGVDIAGAPERGDEHRTSVFAKTSRGQVERPTLNIEGKRMRMRGA